MLKFCKTLLLIYVLVGCGIVTFDELKIESNIAYFGYEFEEDFYILKFSVKPLEPEIENLIIVKRDNVIENCDFRWEGLSLYISPKKGWVKGAFYSVNLNSSIEMSDGRIYSAKIKDYFYYGSIFNRLKLLSWNFENQSDKAAIVFEFSDTVNIDSFFRSFLINPDITFKVEQQNQNIIVSFDTKLPYNSKYVWSLSKELKSDRDYMLFYEETDSFLTEINLERPEFECFCITEKNGENYIFNKSFIPNKNIFGEQSLIFIFKNKIDKKSALSCFTFKPYIKGNYFYYEIHGENDEIISCVIFEPEENWQRDVVYEVKIDSSLKNEYGNTLKEPLFLYFETLGQELNVVSLEAAGKNIGWGNKNSYHQEIVAFEEGNSLEILCSFSKRLSEESITYIRDYISLESFYPITLQNPILEEISFDLINFQYVKMKWSNLVKNEEDSNKHIYYLLKIKGTEQGLHACNDEWMQEDLWVYLYLK